MSKYSEVVRLWWEKAARDFQEDQQLPVEIWYGPHITEEKLQLIGPVAGKHVLEIGCGVAQSSIAFAKQGALVTGVDFTAAQLEFARELAEHHGVPITLIQHDMTDLTPIPSESQDIVFSSWAIGYVEDILACFREVHRVLKADGLFVWSNGHPFFNMIDENLLPMRSYFDTGMAISGLEVSDEPGFAFGCFYRTVSDFYNPLVDAGFRVERMLEPDRRPVDLGAGYMLEIIGDYGHIIPPSGPVQSTAQDATLPKEYLGGGFWLVTNSDGGIIIQQGVK